MDGDSVDCYVDWGAGPMNAHKLAVRYPDSALSIGLNITEGGLASIVVGAYNAIWPGSL
jgi:hypothetical protein